MTTSKESFASLLATIWTKQNTQTEILPEQINIQDEGRPPRQQRIKRTFQPLAASSEAVCREQSQVFRHPRLRRELRCHAPATGMVTWRKKNNETKRTVFLCILLTFQVTSTRNERYWKVTQKRSRCRTRTTQQLPLARKYTAARCDQFYSVQILVLDQLIFRHAFTKLNIKFWYSPNLFLRYFLRNWPKRCKHCIAG